MKKRFLSLAMAFIMILSVIMPSLSYAEEEKISKAPDAVTKTVTVHKLLMTKEKLDNWNSENIEKAGYNGTQNLEEFQKLTGVGNDVSEIKDVYFALKFVGGDNDGKFVKADTQDKTKPADPLAPTEDVKEAVGGLTTTSGITFKTEKLKGKFAIDEIRDLSTYKGTNEEALADMKAVPVEITLPLVVDEGTVLDAHVYPKNTQDKPKIDKNFLKSEAEEKGLTAQEVIENGGFDSKDAAIAGAAYDNYAKEKATVTKTVGSSVPYEVKTQISKGSRYERLVWSDNMTKGLTFNYDLVLEAYKATTTDQKVWTKAPSGDISLTATTDYVIDANDLGFTLRLTEAGLNKIEEAAKESDVEFRLTYSARINSSAVIDMPEKNDIKLIYGHDKGNDNEPKGTKPNNKEITVNKTWADGDPIENVKVTYRLFVKNGDKWNFVKEEVKESAPYNVTFTELDNEKEYKVVEIVDKASYSPEYVSAQNGTITIKNHKNNIPPLDPTEPKVQTGGKKFVKTDNNEKDSAERLAGAMFLVKNASNKYLAYKNDTQRAAEQATYVEKEQAYQEAIKNYNDREDDTQKDQLLTAIETARKARDDAFKAMSYEYEWIDVSDKSVEGVKKTKAVVLTSDNEGRFEVVGLAYGSYKLEEIQAPKGYAKLSDIDFTVSNGSYAGTAAEMQYNKADTNNGYGQQVKNKKVNIPQTGGIGTIVFTVAGLALMAGAVISLRRKNNEA